jgi:hypothetical protein
MLVLSKLSLVVQLEALLHTLYGFFFHSPKKFLEFQSLCDVLIEKGNKLLKNMKIKWSNMFPMKCVMEQYRPFIAMMHDDGLHNNITTKNLSLLCDLKLIFGLHTILPLLDYMTTLIKFVQSCNIFVCVFIDVMKIYQLKFYRLYNDP